jgi:hypothetical protein
MTDPKKTGLPVHGYQPQDPLRIAMVNQNKEAEERLLRQMDAIKDNPDFDQRWLSIARTELEKGFMALNRAVFRPGRIKLPEDAR